MVVTQTPELQGAAPPKYTGPGQLAGRCYVSDHPQGMTSPSLFPQPGLSTPGLIQSLPLRCQWAGLQLQALIS